MKKSVISIFAFLLFGPVTLLAQMPPGSEFKTFTPDTIDFNAQTRYYKATGNFTRSGNSYDSIPSGYDFENYQFDLGSRMAFSPRWGAFASASMGYSQSKDPFKTRTNSSLNEGTLGFDFLMTESASLSLVPEFALTIPFTKNDYNSDTVAVGEGAMAASARLIAFTKKSTFQLGGFAGFQYRDQGLASLLTYGVLGQMNFSSLVFGADVRGYSTIGYDRDSDTDFQRNIYFCKANGCARRYNAVNPSLLESNLWIRWAASRAWELTGGFGMALTGASTSTGYSGNFGAVYHLDTGGSEVSVPAPAARQQRVTTPTFEEKVDDGVDQSLFQQPTPAPAPPQPSMRPAPARPSADAQRKKRQQQMQDELNKTEMQIELKSSKKKRR